MLSFRGQLHNVACDRWPLVPDEGRQRMARMAAAAAWGLGDWDSMEEYTCIIPRDTYDGAFYRAVLAVHQDHFGQAQQVSKESFNKCCWYLYRKFESVFEFDLCLRT